MAAMAASANGQQVLDDTERDINADADDHEVHLTAPARPFRQRKGTKTLCVRSFGVSSTMCILENVEYDWSSSSKRTCGIAICDVPIYNFINSDWEEHARYTAQRQWSHSYIVLGFLKKGIANEYYMIVRPTAGDETFARIRQAIRELRPWWKRLFSLKSIGRFGVYQCFPDHGVHVTVKLSEETQAALTEFYRAFQRDSKDFGYIWSTWIQDNFNAGDRDPTKRKLALQLVLQWSVVKLAIWGISPVLLSLAIGFWYQTIDGDDRNAIIQTAWTISSYIIGTASILIALLAALTQFGDH